MNLRNTAVVGPMWVGGAVTLVLVIGGLAHQRDVAGFAALGALVSAFCRPDPYPVRFGRLLVLAAAICTAIGIGAALGAAGLPAAVGIAVISVIAGAAAYLVWALRIVGPGAVVFVFAAVGAESFARDIADVVRVIAVTLLGAVIGVAAAMAPWWIARLLRRTAGHPSAQRESLRTTVARAPHRSLLARAARITVAGALGAAIASGLGLAHPMWATMGAVAIMQGVGYRMTVHRGVQRLLGNIGGALLAAGLLALPLGYWGAVAAIVVFQVIAELASTVNYAITTLAVTPMALLLTGLGAGLSPAIALDRIADTAIGIVVGIVIAALTISRVDHRDLHGARH